MKHFLPKRIIDVWDPEHPEKLEEYLLPYPVEQLLAYTMELEVVALSRPSPDDPIIMS